MDKCQHLDPPDPFWVRINHGLWSTEQKGMTDSMVDAYTISHGLQVGPAEAALGFMSCSAITLSGLPLAQSSSAAVVVLRNVAYDTICKANGIITHIGPSAAEQRSTNE